jgi:hypothetical protein
MKHLVGDVKLMDMIACWRRARRVSESDQSGLRISESFVR